ncbi:MAG: UBP-type zinc finger domain-containing protein [Bryobacteraceae bacterium]
MKTCEHLKEAEDLQPSRHVCEDCVKTGDSWVHLRICLSCGHVGCCDSSKNKHATKHFHASRHPMIRSIEPGERWGWCYVDELQYDLSNGVKHARVDEA